MSFLGFANYYREFIKGYADKVYPMQQLMRHKDKKFTWNNAAAEAIDKVKQDLATKEIEQRLKQEIERQKLNETLNRSVPMPEAGVGATQNGNCNTLKMVTGKA